MNFYCFERFKMLLKDVAKNYILNCYFDNEFNKFVIIFAEDLPDRIDDKLANLSYKEKTGQIEKISIVKSRKRVFIDEYTYRYPYIKGSKMLSVDSKVFSDIYYDIFTIFRSEVH